MSNTVIGSLMILGGLGLVSGGIMVLTRKAADHSNIAIPDRGVPTSEEKGRIFEEWVVRRFNPAHFAVKEWRGDKHTAGIYAESSRLPDLEIEFRLKDQRVLIAVECKWRRSFDMGEKPGIEWAKERQIANYQRFHRERNIPVFVVIGIGGSPDAPYELYILPLERLRYPFATAEYLAKFRRTNPSTDFYFDARKAELR